MDVETTLYAIRKVDQSVERKDVVRVVRKCERCQSVDPAPVNHRTGKLSVDRVCTRVAINVTHYKNEA